MSLQLLNDNVLVRIHEQTHEGSIFLPEIARDRHEYRLGTVTHTGIKVRNLQPGDEVVLDFGGNWARIDGVLLALVKQGNVMAVLEKNL